MTARSDGGGPAGGAGTNAGTAGQPPATGGRSTSLTDGGTIRDASDSSTDAEGAADAPGDAGAGRWTSTSTGPYCGSTGLLGFLYVQANSVGQTFACTASGNVPKGDRPDFVQGECALGELCAPCYDLYYKRTGVCPP
jgi:hypothetical protein